MGVLERIESIIKANLNDLLKKTNDPEKILQQLIIEMQGELAEAKIQMASAMREGKRLKTLSIENRQLAEKWNKKAILSVQMGKDDLAREAIIKKRTALALVEEYEKEWEIHEGVISSLKSALKTLENKIKEVENRRNELTINRKRTVIDNNFDQSLGEKISVFKKIESKIMSFGAEVEALEELRSSDTKSSQREMELEAELEKLKEKLKSDS